MALGSGIAMPGKLPAIGRANLPQFLFLKPERGFAFFSIKQKISEL
jgi:hypothetical protein